MEHWSKQVKALYNNREKIEHSLFSYGNPSLKPALYGMNIRKSKCDANTFRTFRTVHSLFELV